MMTEVISVISGKGGVGKTTLTANLADALTKQHKSVLVIDANISGANLGLHMNILNPEADLNSVLSGKSEIANAIYSHTSGFHVIPASLNMVGENMRGFKDVISGLVGHFDFILIDTAAGADNEVKEAIAASDSVLIVTNPEIPAVSNAALVKRLATNLGKPVKGIVINMSRGEYLELSDANITKFLGENIISKIPYHKDIKQSIVLGKSVLDYKSASPPSVEIASLSRKLCGVEERKNNIFSALASKIPGLNR